MAVDGEAVPEGREGEDNVGDAVRGFEVLVVKD